MSTDRDVTRIVRSWLEEGATALPDRVLDDVLDQLPATQQRRSWWPTWRSQRMNNLARIAIGAAAVVAIAIVGYNLLPGNTGTGGPAATPTPSPTLVPTPTLEPTPAMTFPADFGDQPTGGTQLPAGDWFLTAVEPLRITITLPEKWYKGRHEWAVFPDPQNSPSIAFLDIGNLFVNPCDTSEGLLDPPPGPTVDDLVIALSGVPGLTASEPTDVTKDGYSGKQLVLSGGLETCVTGEPVLWRVGVDDLPAPGVGDALHLWILDVEGTRLVIGILGSQSPEPRMAEAQAIVDSIQIEP